MTYTVLGLTLATALLACLTALALRDLRSLRRENARRDRMTRVTNRATRRAIAAVAADLASDVELLMNCDAAESQFGDTLADRIEALEQREMWPRSFAVEPTTEAQWN